MNNNDLFAGNGTIYSVGDGQNSNLFGFSKSMLNLFQLADVLSNSPNTPVLITGDKGTGKSLFARAIHYNGVCSENHFIEVKSKRSSSESLDQIFNSIGRNTIFLRNIDYLSLERQAQVINLLESKKSSHRIIASTTKDLPELIEEGKFESDLLYLLNISQLNIPNLYQRKDELIGLSEHLVSSSYANNNSKIIGLKDSAKEIILSHNYERGNITELKLLLNSWYLTKKERYFILEESTHQKTKKRNNESQGPVRIFQEKSSSSNSSISNSNDNNTHSNYSKREESNNHHSSIEETVNSGCGSWLEYFFGEDKYQTIQGILNEDSERGKVFRDYCSKHPYTALGILKRCDIELYKDIGEHKLKDFIPSAWSIKKHPNYSQIQKSLESKIPPRKTIPKHKNPFGLKDEWFLHPIDHLLSEETLSKLYHKIYTGKIKSTEQELNKLYILVYSGKIKFQK